MASAKCPKCDSRYFELETTRPQGSRIDICFVRCKSCGAVVGTIQDSAIAEGFKKQNEVLKLIAERLDIYVNL